VEEIKSDVQVGNDDVEITFPFNNKEITIKVDPAILDAFEQEQKVYGYTNEEILCTGYYFLFKNYSIDELMDMDLSDFGVTFPAIEYKEDMSVSEFMDIDSDDLDILNKQIELASKRQENLAFIMYVYKHAKSAFNKNGESNK
jgi:hypothetical protein